MIRATFPQATPATFEPLIQALTVLNTMPEAAHLPMTEFVHANRNHITGGIHLAVYPDGPDDVKAWGDFLGQHTVKENETHGTFHEAEGVVGGVLVEVRWIDKTAVKS